jgi:hypothetical protein
MTQLPIPAVPDLARARGETRDELISWFLGYYDTDGAPFNYLSGTRAIKYGYKGVHTLDQLVAACAKEKTAQGQKSNSEIVQLAAPISFGRATQVFDLPRRQFHFGRDINAGYRIPFFFVENGTVKLYYLQPRKSCNLTYDQLCMVATIHKKYLLDTEFFGQLTDVEYVDVSADPTTKLRGVRQYSLPALTRWSDKRLADRLTLIAEALEYVRSNDIVRPRRRINRRPDAGMPLYD